MSYPQNSQIFLMDLRPVEPALPRLRVNITHLLYDQPMTYTSCRHLHNNYNVFTPILVSDLMLGGW